MEKEGIKFDGDKNRVDLLPIDAIEEIASILTYGAKKYTIDVPTNIDNVIQSILKELDKWDVKIILIEKSTLKDSVDPVMKKTYEKRTLNSLRDNERIEEDGQKEILKRLKNMQEIDLHHLIVGKEIKKINEKIFFYKEDLQKKEVIYYWNTKEMNVLFVEEIFQDVKDIWTMIIRVGKQEDIFVVGATMDLDFLTIVSKILKKRYSILKNLQLPNFLYKNNQYYESMTGNRNWEKGMTWSRLFGACLRHLFAWWRGEKFDPETKKTHLAHAGCCILFMISHELRQIGNDDRVKEESKEYQNSLKDSTL